MNCELCGREGNLLRVKIEGTSVKVCGGCSRFGKKEVNFSSSEKESSKKKYQLKEEEKIEVVVRSFSSILKRKREERRLTQEELAKKIKEKESVIQKLERAHMEPSLKIIKKLEKFFGIKLIQERAGQIEKIEKEEREERKGLTLGDLFAK